jgi:hypothetical protein
MVSPMWHTALTRVPRESQKPGRPFSAVPCQVHARPSRLVA